MARNLRKSSSFLSALLLVVVVTTPSLHALSSGGGTTIQTTVCSTDVAAAISIDQPASDTTIARSSFSLSGTIRHISQIDVYVDDAYDQTKAIGANQDSYSVNVSTDKGTHTIKVVGFGICGGQTVETSTVVTINPIVEEGPVETQTPTQTDQTTTETETDVETIVYDGVIIGDDATIPFVQRTELSPAEFEGSALSIAPNDFSVPRANLSVALQKPVETVKVAVFTAAVAGLVFQQTLVGFLQLSIGQSRWLIGGMIVLLIGSLLLS